LYEEDQGSTLLSGFRGNRMPKDFSLSIIIRMFAELGMKHLVILLHFDKTRNIEQSQAWKPIL
jgi:hypothetical protein